MYVCAAHSPAAAVPSGRSPGSMTCSLSTAASDACRVVAATRGYLLLTWPLSHDATCNKAHRQ
jgi:hypothetical protein